MKAISEDRSVDRAKYSELKIQAQFLKVSPGYVTAKPLGVGDYCGNPGIVVSRLKGAGEVGDFYVIRHRDYRSQASTNFRLRLPLVLEGTGDEDAIMNTGILAIHGRDSKMLVTNYNLHGVRILYSTAEIFTHHKSGEQINVLVYSSGSNEVNELAIVTDEPAEVFADPDKLVEITAHSANQGQLVTFKTVPKSSPVIRFGNCSIYTMSEWYYLRERPCQAMDANAVSDREEAYTYWPTEILGTSISIIVRGPYLVRSTHLNGDTLKIEADFKADTNVEIIGLPHEVRWVCINSAVNVQSLTTTAYGSRTFYFKLPALGVDLPKLEGLDWNFVDSLPEIESSYEDCSWPIADKTSTTNTNRLHTPTSLYGSDYGFHAGVLIYRGHFTAEGTSGNFRIKTQGGTGFASSIWLNGTFLGSWAGSAGEESKKLSYPLRDLVNGKSYILTVLVDNMGYDHNAFVGWDTGKAPRGIMDYSLQFGFFSKAPITWKITGNIGGEDYVDHVRGPLNEGGLFLERQGLHLPGVPLDQVADLGFTSKSPFRRINKPGVSFYTARLDLDLPSAKWDIPLALVFKQTPSPDNVAFRAQIWVNGWNFGRYVSNLGPQTSFPVPEGIWNYAGENWVGLAIWALEADGVEFPGLELQAGTPVFTGRERVTAVNSPRWTKREGVY